MDLINIKSEPNAQKASAIANTANGNGNAKAKALVKGKAPTRKTMAVFKRGKEANGKVANTKAELLAMGLAPRPKKQYIPGQYHNAYGLPGGQRSKQPWAKWQPPKRFPWNETGAAGCVGVLQVRSFSSLCCSFCGCGGRIAVLLLSRFSPRTGTGLLAQPGELAIYLPLYGLVSVICYRLIERGIAGPLCTWRACCSASPSPCTTFSGAAFVVCSGCLCVCSSLPLLRGLCAA